MEEPLDIAALAAALEGAGPQKRDVAMLEGTSVKLVRVQGENPWHVHEGGAEGYYVLAGTFRIDTAGGSTRIPAGGFYTVPAGVVHRGASPVGCTLLRFEPAGPTRRVGGPEAS